MADLLGILRIKDSNGNWVSVPGLKGDTGEPFKILGIYATAAALEADVEDPGVGDVYLVGTTGAYDIYLYLADGWHNTGRYMPKGDQGDPAPQSAITSAVETWLAANVDPETGYVLDRTLSQSNAAAPADLVGDLKESLNEVTELTTTLEYTPTPAETTWTFGVMGTNGVPAENSSYKYTNKIAVSKGQQVFVDDGRGGSVATAARVTVYSGETANSAQGGSNLPLPFTIPDGIDGVIITVNKGYIYDNAFVNVTNATRVNILDDTIDELSGDISNLEDAVSDLQTAQEQMSDDIDELDSGVFTKVYPKRIFNTTWTSGVCSTDGSIAANDSYRYSNHISVNIGDEIYVDRGDTYETPVATAARVTAYKNNSAVRDKGGTNVSLPYVVPEGVDEVVITVNKGYIQQDTSFLYAKIPETVPMGEYNLNNDNKNLSLSLDAVESGIISGFAIELVHSYDVPHNKKAMYMAVDVDQYGVLSTDASRLKSLIPYFYFNGEKIGTVVLYDTNGDPFVYGKDGTKIVLGGGN